MSDEPQGRSRAGTRGLSGDPWGTHWHIDAGLSTEAGRRKSNQDTARIANEVPLYMVADGMGGHRAGDRASFIAVECLHEYIIQSKQEGLEPDGDLMREAMETANMIILEDAALDDSRAGMGTTLTALLLSADRFWIGHVGDSRAWLIRERRIEQLTEDHSIVAAQVRDGTITEEEAKTHPLRNVLSQSLGLEGKIAYDVLPGYVQADDRFVLASDGLSSGLGADDILSTVEAAADAASASQTLVHKACEVDDSDNITALVVACRAG